MSIFLGNKVILVLIVVLHKSLHIPGMAQGLHNTVITMHVANQGMPGFTHNGQSTIHGKVMLELWLLGCTYLIKEYQVFLVACCSLVYS